MRVVSVVGTRPEAIKMASVIKELAEYPEIESIVCSTGQHREMLRQMFALFDIRPTAELNIMRPNQTPLQVAAAILDKMGTLLAEYKPDWVLVQGDTTTVMATAIAAHYMQIKVGHIEAGLRSFDRANPFPEEMNRVVADHVSDLHFAPTQSAKQNLLGEGIAAQTICVTGNTVIDALEIVSKTPRPASITHLVDDDRHIILVTAHRRENQGKPLQRICQALRQLANRADVHIIYPVHHNPNIKQPVYEALSNIPNITLLEPLGYPEMVHLLKACRFVLTDSGGVQEEAPMLGIPVLVLRETTERPEAVLAGAVQLVGTDVERIVEQSNLLLDDQHVHQQMAQAINPYGDGKAAQRLVARLLHPRIGAVGLHEWEQ